MLVVELVGCTHLLIDIKKGVIPKYSKVCCRFYFQFYIHPKDEVSCL